MATPYMGLNLPIVSSTVGPTWASYLNTALTSVDSHNHSPGNGNLVPTSGININSDLSFNSSFNATSLRSIRFVNQGSPLGLGTDLGCIYESGGNMYWNSSSGAQVQITAGAALNGSSLGAIGGDYSTSTASLFYTSASKTFTFWQAASTPAKIDTGDILLRAITTPTNAITLFAPTSLASSYSLKLPTGLPGSTLPMTSDASGNLAFTNIFTSIAAADANSVINAYTRPTGSTVSNRGVGTSNSSGSRSTSSASFIDVTDGSSALSVTITTSGRPVMVCLISASTTNPGTLGISKVDSVSFSNISGQFRFLRDGSGINIHPMQLSFPADTSLSHVSFIPSSSMSFVDIVGAGTYVYKVQMLAGPHSLAEIDDTKLCVYEL